MEHVHAELRRLSMRLANFPHPNEHAGLYAAQQALWWALNPEQFAPPFRTVTGIEEGSTDYCADSCPPASGGIFAATQDAA